MARLLQTPSRTDFLPDFSVLTKSMYPSSKRIQTCCLVSEMSKFEQMIYMYKCIYPYFIRLKVYKSHKYRWIHIGHFFELFHRVPDFFFPEKRGHLASHDNSGTDRPKNWCLRMLDLGTGEKQNNQRIKPNGKGNENLPNYLWMGCVSSQVNFNASLMQL